MDSEILGWLRRVWNSPFDVAYGIYYGYPLCCIAHYVLDNFLNLASANERGGVKMPWKPEESYVPCVLCKRRRDRRRDRREIESLAGRFNDDFNYRNYL